MDIKIEENSYEIPVLKKCSFCLSIFSVKNHEDINDHVSNCTKYQELFSKGKDKHFCPICHKKIRNSLIFHVKFKHFTNVEEDDDFSDCMVLSDSDYCSDSNNSPGKEAVKIDFIRIHFNILSDLRVVFDCFLA